MWKSILLIALLFAAVNAEEKNCEAQEFEKADTCFNNLIFLGNTKEKFPSTNEELKVLCSKIQENEKCLRNFARNCLNKINQQVIGLILRGTSNLVKNFCKNNNLSFQLSKCANPQIQIDHACMKTYVQDTKNLAKSQDQNLKLPGICCTFNKFYSCVIDKLEVSENCPQTEINRYAQFIEKISGDALNLACNDYRNNKDKCTNIDVKLSQLPKAKLPGKTIILPLVGVLNSLN